jgi:hypothetical protein
MKLYVGAEWGGKELLILVGETVSLKERRGS